MAMLKGFLLIGMLLGVVGVFAYRGVRTLDKAGHAWWVIVLLVGLVSAVLAGMAAVALPAAVYLVCFAAGVALSAVSAIKKVGGVIAGASALAWLVGGWPLVSAFIASAAGFALTLCAHWLAGVIHARRESTAGDKSL